MHTYTYTCIYVVYACKALHSQNSIPWKLISRGFRFVSFANAVTECGEILYTYIYIYIHLL